MGWIGAITAVAAALKAQAAAASAWLDERRKRTDADLAAKARAHDRLAAAVRARLRHRDDAASGRLPDDDPWRRD